MKKIIILIISLLIISTLSIYSQDVIEATQNDFPKLTGPYLGQKPPGMTPEVFAPEIISKPGRFEYRLLIRPNTDEVYYEIWNKNTQRPSSYMIKWKDTFWTSPQVVFPEGQYNNELACFSEEGKFLFFSTNEPNGAYSYDIKYMTWENGKWSSPQSLGEPVNTTQREQFPSISSNRNLYYFSNTNHGTGIFRSQWINNLYKQPEALSEAVNSDEAHNPCIAADESFIIFTSYRSGGLGEADLYISFKNQDDTWTKAQNMGSTINTAFQDDYASISPDGKYLFFASDRNEKGYCDIFWVDASFIEELRKKMQKAEK